MAHEAEFALFRMGRINALMRIVSAQLSALETLPPQHFAEFRRHLGSSSGSQSVQFRAIEAASGLREPHFMQVLQEHGEIPDVVQRALARPPLQDLFLDLLRKQPIELEALYVGERPTTAVLSRRGVARVRAAVRAVALQARAARRARARAADRRTGGTLGSKYLQKTISQRFFPKLWDVRSKFFQG